jgi:phospholipid transport system transporter-binding protein
MSSQSVLFTPSDLLTFDTVECDRHRLITDLQKKTVEHLRFDLSHVVHCDSAGLALLIEATRLCRRYKATLEIAGMPDAIYALAEFCGVEDMLNL